MTHRNSEGNTLAASERLNDRSPPILGSQKDMSYSHFTSAKDIIREQEEENMLSPLPVAYTSASIKNQLKNYQFQGIKKCKVLIKTILS